MAGSYNSFFSNRIEQISNEFQFLKIWFHPVVGVESNVTNFELIFIEFFEYFLPFESIKLQIFESAERISNEFQFDSTPIL